ncbi:MAG TPA: SulP family inorganic anion transporter [Bacteroidia bacterium]|jgi:MFS superfamily sulfate permease-like transporter|nr:SulP family inorganic anion transporter [Bacteroidia bacterium]
MHLFKYFKNDLKAGIVVFLVALPLCLGIALAQKAPLFSGMISGIIGGIIVGLISGSRLSVSGPAAGLTSIVLAATTTLGSFETFLLSLCLAGVFQIILSFIKAGIIGYYIPSSVIKGMLAAIGIILIIKQIPHLVGYDHDPEGDETFMQADGQNSFSELLNMLNYVSIGPMIIGILSFTTLILWETKKIKNIQWLRVIPAPLMVVTLAALTNMAFVYFLPALKVKAEHMVTLPSIRSVNDLVSNFTFPDFSKLNLFVVYETAFTIAAVASLETLLNLEAVDKLDPQNSISPANRELLAQGTGNLLCGLLGGLPITSVIIRSSANINAGGKTKLSAIVHGFLFIVALFLIPGLLSFIPLSCLAAILIYTGFKLTAPKIYTSVYKIGKDQFIPFIITIVVMLLTDLLKGVSVGIVAGIIFILRNNYKTPYKLFEEEIEGRRHFFIKLSPQITFINKGKIVQLLHKLPDGCKVYLDGGNTHFIDKDVIEMISEFKRSCVYKNIEIDAEGIPEVETISTN